MDQQGCFSNLAKLRQELYADSGNEAITVGLHYSDVVKVLVDDRQDEGCQIALLVMLQDAGSCYQSKETAYDAVESLKSAFGALKRTTRYNVQSQTLITMTTIILSHQSADYAQLYELVEFLVENVVQVKRNHPLVRAAGCSCLREIEIFHPGFLAKHMEQLWGTFGKDYSWAWHSLAQLLAVGTTASNTPTQGIASDEPARSLHEVSALLGCIPLMTPVAAAAVMQSLLANLVDGLPPALLKLCCSQFSSCYELPLVQLMLTMQGEVCREPWWQELRLEVIQWLADGLHCPKSQQALKISWLGSALSHTAGLSKASWHLLPMPRDEVTQQGLRLQATLATGFDAWGGPEQMLDAVIPYLRILKRHVCLAPGHFGIHLLFHVLYRLYVDLRNTTVAASLTEEITRLVINMTTLGPLYCRSLLNFLKCIETGFPESSLSQVVLMEAVDMVTGQSWEDCVQGSAVESCLLVLTAAVQKPGNLCQPKQLFHFIERLVANQGLSAHRGWLLGNRLIDLCCSVVLHQKNHAIGSDLCTILSYLMDSSEDVDVKSRVKLLYASLSALSESKAQQLLYCCNHDPALDSEKDCNILSDFPVPSPVVCPTAELLRLERLLPDGSHLQPCDQVPCTEAQGGRGLCLDELQKYRAFLESDFDHVVSIPCRLVLESSEPRFDCLMGLQLNLAPPEGWGTAQGLEASVFWKSDSGVTTSIALSPQASVPCSIAVMAEFTSLDSCSHVCWLEPLQVRFEDLLLPLPIPEPLPDEVHLSPDTYRAMVWHSLWEQLNVSPEAQLSTLRLCPSPPSQQLWLQLCEGLAPFVVRWQPRGLQAAFVVPRRIHVLLSLRACGPHLIASLMVEDWRLLPRVQTFLQSLCTLS
ncbi:uncharacterized protein [Dermacentor andersoni]|uniref:uncharacterized protein isoform X1 n=2 Tax=Dermacentor andersoni TaxID=34620 RepID=UPI002155717B|nr:uncharacterized protein LOC126545444 isoform X1 [Dermacentor andersoni]